MGFLYFRHTVYTDPEDCVMLFDGRSEWDKEKMEVND